mgnify:CR=1 FL=1
MIIGSISENKDVEKRVSITPEIAKKYINIGFEINLSENYGKHLGFKEKEYNELGVKFISDDKKLVENADIIIQMSLLDEDKTSLLKSNQTFIGVLNPNANKNKFQYVRAIENYRKALAAYKDYMKHERSKTSKRYKQIVELAKTIEEHYVN